MTAPAARKLGASEMMKGLFAVAGGETCDEGIGFVSIAKTPEVKLAARPVVRRGGLTLRL